MNKVIIAVFGKEEQAFEGLKSLKSLHADGSISLYASAVVAKDSDGKASIKQESEEGPIGTTIGLFTGSLIGLFGGPVGMLVGAGFGAIGGGIYDFSKADIDVAFLNEVSEELTPGKVAVLAEVDETWTTPVDSSLEKLGAMIFRRNKAEIEDDHLLREAEAINDELNELDEELEEADDNMKESIKNHMQSLKEKSKALKEATNNRLKHSKKKMEAKVNKLDQQIENAGNRRKKKLEKRKAELKEDYKAQEAKLGEISKNLMVIV